MFRRTCRKLLGRFCSTPMLLAPSQTMKKIQDLRMRTDAPIVDCKAALQMHPDDVEAAVKWLHNKGVVSAVKKGDSDRVTDHGVLMACIPSDCASGLVLQVRTETDFAARNDKFVEGMKNVRKEVEALLRNPIPENFCESVLEQNEACKKLRMDLIASLGEKIIFAEGLVLPPPTPIEQPASDDGKPKKQIVVTDQAFGCYVHNEVGGRGSRIGNIVGLVRLASFVKQTEGVSLAESRDANEIRDDANSLAQHIVANMSNDQPLLDQQFVFGGDGTGNVRQWLKKRRYLLQGALASKMGSSAVLRH